MLVRPAPNPGEPGTRLRVRDPDLKDFLPEEGRDVPPTAYWNRQLHVFKDVELVTPPADKPVTETTRRTKP